MVISVLLLPCFGGAHTAGLSTAHFEALPGGRVEARLTFASDEPLGQLHVDLDRDRDGVVTAEDVAAAEGDLRALVLDGVELSADGSPCGASFEGAAIDDVDGLVLRAAYVCPASAGELSATLYFLSALSPGHREIARISAGSATTQAVLSGESRAIALRLPPSPPGSRRSSIAAAILGGATVVALGLIVALVVRRRRRPTS